jgi:hypothetical protein
LFEVIMLMSAVITMIYAFGYIDGIMRCKNYKKDRDK